MNNQNVIIEASDDGEKKWIKLGTFLNEDKAYQSLTWQNAIKKYPYCSCIKESESIQNFKMVILMEANAVKKLMVGLLKLGLDPKYEPSIDWENEDDTIIINKDLHIQIGTCYMCIVQVVPNVGFDFSQEYQTVKAVLNQIKKIKQLNN